MFVYEVEHYEWIVGYGFKQVFNNYEEMIMHASASSRYCDLCDLIKFMYLFMYHF
jgi:hypothetical protein